MPEYDIKGSDGNYKVRADNAQDAQNAVNQQEFGTATVGAVGAVLGIAKFIPSLICMVIGFITGLLLKLGIVGRIILTAIFAVCVFLLTALPLQYFLAADSGPREAVGVALWLALAVPATLWFFLKHYRTIKDTPIADFKNNMTLCGTIVFWGILGLAAIGQLTGIATHGGSDSAFIFIPLAAATVYWFKLTGETRRAMVIVIAAALGLILLDVVTTNINRAQRETARIEALTEAAKENPALLIVNRETPFEATVTADTQIKVGYGDLFTIPAGSTITVTNFGWVGENESTTYHAYIDFEGRDLILEQFDTIKPVE